MLRNEPYGALKRIQFSINSFVELSAKQMVHPMDYVLLVLFIHMQY